MKNSGPQTNPWKYAGLATAIGTDLALCLVAGYYGGNLLADRTGQRLWIAMGLLLGLVVALTSIVFMIKRIVEESNE